MKQEYKNILVLVASFLFWLASFLIFGYVAYLAFNFDQAIRLHYIGGALIFCSACLVLACFALYMAIAEYHYFVKD